MGAARARGSSGVAHGARVRSPTLVHDFKNQLGIVLGFAELLIAETPDHDPRKADLQEIHKAAGEALKLLSRLNEFIPRAQD